MSDDSVYVAFCVYEDSFPAFIRAKQLASDCGLAYGWEPFQLSDGPVSFGSVVTHLNHNNENVWFKQMRRRSARSMSRR